MANQADAATEALGTLARERGKVEARIEAYERGAWDSVLESPNPLGAQAACEALADAGTPEVVSALQAESAKLDELESRYDKLEDALEEEVSALSEQRVALVGEHNEKRKGINRANMMKGFWRIYFGVAVCVLAAFCANSLGLGMFGAVAAGALGYAAGAYIFKVLAARFIRTDPEAEAALREELDLLREKHDAISAEIDSLKERLASVNQGEEYVDELQLSIQDALDDIENLSE